MATAFPHPTEHGDDCFVLELNREKDKVRTTFHELRKILTETETNLMKQLDDILSAYNCYTDEVNKMNVKKRDFEDFRKAQMTIVPTSPDLKTFHEKILQDLNQQLKQIQFPVRPKAVTFVCDEKKLLAELNELCKLVERVSEIDYKSKSRAVISVCDKRSGDEQLNGPQGVAVDHNTGNIYVADCSNNCVKVFNNIGKYLFKFGDVKGEGKMSGPDSLLVCGNRVIVAQCSHFIQVHQLDGKFVSKIGGAGSGKLHFNFPYGISTNECNGDIYICDYCNNRIQVLSDTFEYKSEFGKDILLRPRDVKLYKDYIFILDESNPCLHIFNKDLVLQKSVVTRGEGQQVINPWFFFIDKFGSILFSDRGSNSILILNSEFQFIHKISVSNYPMGITMDKEDRVIVCCAANNCLQIF